MNLQLQNELVLISDTNSSTQILRIDSNNEDETWIVQMKNRKQIYKFCSICGHMLRNVGKTLTDHFSAQHQNNSQEFKPQFQKKNEKPSDCKYSNWNEYINNPDEVKPKLKEGSKVNTGGRKQIELAPIFEPNLFTERTDYMIVKKQRELILNKKNLQKIDKRLYRENETVSKEFHMLIKRQLYQLLDGKNIKIPVDYYKHKFEKKMRKVISQYVDKIQEVKYKKNNEISELKEQVKVRDQTLQSKFKTIDTQTQMITGLQESLSIVNSQLKQAKDKLEIQKKELLIYNLKIQYSTPDQKNHYELMNKLQDQFENTCKQELEDEKIRRKSAEEDLKSQLSRFEYHKKQNELLEQQKLNWENEYKELEKQNAKLQKENSSLLKLDQYKDEGIRIFMNNTEFFLQEDEQTVNCLNDDQKQIIQDIKDKLLNDTFMLNIKKKASLNLNQKIRTIAQLQKYKENNEKEKEKYKNISIRIKDKIQKEWEQEENIKKQTNDLINFQLVQTLKKLHFQIDNEQDQYFFGIKSTNKIL